MKIFYLALLIWNITVMFIYGTDKLFAKKKSKRISEKTLIISALLLGGVGAMFGMVLFNHKTSKMKFRIFVPLATLLSVALVMWITIMI